MPSTGSNLEAALEFLRPTLDADGRSPHALAGSGYEVGLGSEAEPDDDADPEEVERLHVEHYWDPTYEALPATIAAKTFDLGALAGRRAAVVLLQQAVNAVRGRFLEETGELDARTAAAAGACRPEALLEALCGLARLRYEGMAAEGERALDFRASLLVRAARKP